MIMKYYKRQLLKILLTFFVCPILQHGIVNAQQPIADLQDVQEIVAIVNDEVISLYDLKQRTLLLALSSSSGQITQEQEQLLQQQAMSGLIDDKLKLEEAEKYKAIATETEMATSYRNYARQFNLEPDVLETRLNEAGVAKKTLEAQLGSSMAWQRVTFGLLEPMANVTDDEVMNYIEKMERDKGKFEFQVSEIFLPISNNAQREEVKSAANIMHEQLATGVDFPRVAQQFSQSSTASVGGDMGWIMDNELPEEVNTEIRLLETGTITEPIVTEQGVYILKLNNKRRILTLDENDIAVNLRFLFFSKKEFQDDTLGQLKKSVLEVIQSPNTCEETEIIATTLNATNTGTTGVVRVGDLPAEMRAEILKLDVGYGTPLSDEDEGYRSFVLCSKDIPQIVLPEYEAVLKDMTSSRLQLIARRHLRDLRRDAIVDYR